MLLTLPPLSETRKKDNFLAMFPMSLPRLLSFQIEVRHECPEEPLSPLLRHTHHHEHIKHAHYPAGPDPTPSMDPQHRLHRPNINESSPDFKNSNMFIMLSFSSEAPSPKTGREIGHLSVPLNTQIDPGALRRLETSMSSSDLTTIREQRNLSSPSAYWPLNQRSI